ncbi:carbohydrate ABC transporter permease [Paenibacillus agaridevorans]|uniref:Carbohydrate ABC transporter permease n=1 Tax=Paenibacillus agaridevorans TaxID=171404 RepID=A0A2R5EJ21_9BACL|nr:carbohydrate ABC transporter permease [Paenibacillus agaridevorans]GBG05619.1 carbohydrate ABC transporter permease [Paenibacillus agaridevorans]
MKQSRIKEKGQTSFKAFAYAFSILSIVLLLFPLGWAISSSLKDPISLYQFPPKWIPEQPQVVTIVVDYSDSDMSDQQALERDGLKAMWYSWKRKQNEAIGEMRTIGMRDGRVLYEMKMRAFEFNAGRSYVLPTEVFTDQMMKTKYMLIKERGYSHVTWHGLDSETVYSPKQRAVSSTEDQLSAQIDAFLQSSSFLEGDVRTVSQSGDWMRIFDNYLAIFKENSLTSKSATILNSFMNSVYVVVLSIFSQLLLGGTAAYAISKLIGKQWSNRWTLFFVATIMIPEVAIIVPLYLVIGELGLTNNLWGVILPHTSWGIVIYMFKGFFDQIPDEMLQAARMDGANEWRIFYSMIVKLSIPIFTVISIMTFMAVWNEFLWPLIVLRDESLYTFTLYITSEASRPRAAGTGQSTMAMLLLAAIPLMVVFATCQRLIERGVSWSSGVKG